jgi:hypothetical protein
MIADTTNRWSLVTLISDPHYSVPGVNLMPRRMAAWYVTRLWRVSDTYNVGWYFSRPGLQRLIGEAGLSAQEVRGLYEEKIRSGDFASARGRKLLRWLLGNSWAQAAAVCFVRTSLFNTVVQPGWEFLAARPNSPPSTTA